MTRAKPLVSGTPITPPRYAPRDIARTEWWTDHTNLAALYRWLCDNDRLDPADVGEVAYYLSKPWKWSADYAEMCHGNTDLETKLEASLREVGVCDDCDAPADGPLCETHEAHATIPSPPPVVTTHKETR